MAAVKEEGFPTLEQQLFLKKFALAQMSTYEGQPTSLGWTFWNFKTEKSPMWNYMLGNYR